jgi:sigma-B regulation protein RsbU (phosphoserine phosphatase)
LPYESSDICIGPGDIVVLYSDGVPDAQNPNDEEFGEERLREVIRAAAAEPARAIVTRVFAAIDAFVGDAPQFDDITLMVLKRLRT